MQLHHSVLSAIAGTVAMQLAPCQAPTMVSMSVTTTIGVVGQACEPFQCLPHQTLANLGEVVGVEVFGQPGMPYVLFAGTPVSGCQPILSLGGALAVWAPIITLEIGLVSSAPLVPCALGSAVTACTIPITIPVGMQLRLQSLSVDPISQEPAFSRAVEIHTR